MTKPKIPRRVLNRRRVAQAKRAFLEYYAQYGNVGYSAQLAGCGRSSIYSWQENDDEFAAAFRAADVAATEVLEREAWRRGVEGSPYERTSYWHGEPVGTDRKIEYSDALLTLLLKARAPDKYREKVDLAVSQVIKAVSGFDPAEVLGAAVHSVAE